LTGNSRILDPFFARKVKSDFITPHENLGKAAASASWFVGDVRLGMDVILEEDK